MSNLNCTNDTEAVLASNSKTIQVYIEKTKGYNVETGIIKHFLTPDRTYGTLLTGVIERPVSYDEKMYWLMGKPSKDGFFTLTHPNSGQLLTALFTNGLVIRGNCQISINVRFICVFSGITEISALKQMYLKKIRLKTFLKGFALDAFCSKAKHLKMS